jgi:hypothetical protein
MNAAVQACDISQAEKTNLSDKLNGIWHEKALWAYTAIVLAHWAEHFVQAFQIYVMGWKLADARGVLGLYFPALIKSELLHYGYALVMLVCFWILRKGFVGRSYTWWMVAFWIQFWHHIEHGLLQAQAILGSNLAGSPVPLSLAQFVIPRVELHLFYNTLVTIPMVIAMFYHMFPTPEEEAHTNCSCSWHPKSQPSMKESIA